jgi:RNA polymerase sigma-70 factor (ECF subfamily)
VNQGYRKHSDEYLMKLLAEGDGNAFGEIYDRYNKPLVVYFTRMLWKDKEKGRDFMHDLFAKIIDRPKLYNPERPFKTWVYSVAHNMCKNEYRKQEVRSNTAAMLHENTVGNIETEKNKNMDAEEFNKALYTELEKLEEIQRTTFLMRYKMDLSIKEIADITESNEGTVKSRLFYTLKKLSEKLKVFDPKLSSQGIH